MFSALFKILSQVEILNSSAIQQLLCQNGETYPLHLNCRITKIFTNIVQILYLVQTLYPLKITKEILFFFGSEWRKFNNEEY